MDPHWNLCPYCGNKHIDPYHVGPPVILAEDIITEEDARKDSVEDEEATLQSEETETDAA
jgi:hypothetical protein